MNSAAFDFVRRHRKAVLALAVVAAAAAAAYLYYPRRVFGDGNAEVTVKRTFLFKHDAAMVDKSLVFSSDFTRYAYTVKREGGYAVVVDGVEGPVYDQAGYWEVQYLDYQDPLISSLRGVSGTLRSRIVFSRDGGSVAYAAKKGDKYVVVVDGVEGREYDDVGFPESCAVIDHSALYERPIFLSGEGAHFLFTARRGAKWLVVLDGAEGGEYNEVRLSHWRYLGADLQHPFYAARRGDKWLVVVHGVEGKQYDEIGKSPFVFSRDAWHFAYTGRSEHKWFVIADGSEGKGYDAAGIPAFSDDGNHLGYPAQEGGEWFFVRDGAEGPRCEDLHVFEWDGDARPCVYAMKKEGKWRLVSNGTEGKPYDAIEQVRWSSGRARMAYIARDAGKACVVLDGVEGEPYDQVHGLVFSPDGRRFAYEAKTGAAECAVVDGVKGKPYDQVWNVIFSPDSRRFAYEAISARRACNVIDGEEQAWYDWVSFAKWSDDGNHCYYRAQSSNRRVITIAQFLNRVAHRGLFQVRSKSQWSVVVDGVRGAGYNTIFWEWTTGDGRHLFYLAERKGKCFIVVDGLEKTECPPPAISGIIGPHERIRYVAGDDKGCSAVEITVAGK